MHPDVIDLRDFYTSPLGIVVRRLVGLRIRERCGNLQGLTVLGLGYAPPYLSQIKGGAACLGALMPAEQGVLAWPKDGARASVLVEDHDLPLPDNCVDRVLLVHMLEASRDPRALLRELWRVLRPDGRLQILVPNRRGLWAHLDTTPFGQGRPYSKGQLSRLLKDAMFTPEDWRYALYMPPWKWRLLLRWAGVWERLGLILWPAFPGVILAEASKQVYAAIPIRETRRARGRLAPAPAAAAAMTGASEPFSATEETPPVRRSGSA